MNASPHACLCTTCVQWCPQRTKCKGVAWNWSYRWLEPPSQCWASNKHLQSVLFTPEPTLQLSPFETGSYYVTPADVEFTM